MLQVGVAGMWRPARAQPKTELLAGGVRPNPSARVKLGTKDDMCSLASTTSSRPVAMSVTVFFGTRWSLNARTRRCKARALPDEERYWELSEEERARFVEEMDTNAPYRYLLLFLAALLVGKALPDAVFSYLKNLAGIRGAVLDPSMLAFDALLCGLGVGLAYAALTLLGAPELPEPPEREKSAGPPPK
ncbi:unnamed protein product [Symbiodinium natans]|uniref:Uncharacterized protein n=1 Tax=Symbiodinium natans TaxID=878477 RepID=A0A812NCT9_9DINO|nr:unnamed protein product [Symbiodinium natans]